MFLANRDPAADLAVMAAARENLRRLAPRRLVLISSIAVYRDSRGKDEASPMETEGLPPYGANRLPVGTVGAGGLSRRADRAAARPVRQGAEKELSVRPTHAHPRAAEAGKVRGTGRPKRAGSRGL